MQYSSHTTIEGTSNIYVCCNRLQFVGQTFFGQIYCIIQYFEQEMDVCFDVNTHLRQQQTKLANKQLTTNNKQRTIDMTIIVVSWFVLVWFGLLHLSVNCNGLV